MPNYVGLQSAQEILATAKRVLVVGCSGGGKSTLSQKISARFDMEYISLDRDVRWLPGWTVRDRLERRELLKKFVSGERWVIDGTSAASMDIRLPRTDLVLWVRVPRRVALTGVARRVFRYYGTTRPDMAEGCKELLPDREFLSFIWNFEKETVPKLVHSLDLHGPGVPVHIMKSHQAIAKVIE